MQPTAKARLPWFLLAVSFATTPAAADDPEASAQEAAESVEYDAAFFARYQPNTALDMVNQLPGFVLDDGADARGFASAAGNILIDDRRPSAKQDLPSAILARIPATQVARIEVIRSQVRDIDLQGRAIVANVILRDVDKATVRWHGAYRYNVEFGSTTELDVSVSNRRGNIDYNAGLDLRHNVRGDYTPESILDGNDDLVEERFGLGGVSGDRGGLNLNAAATVDDTLFRLNAQASIEKRDGERLQQRTPVSPPGPTVTVEFPQDMEIRDLEVGFDAERELSEDLIGKAILLFFTQDLDTVNTQTSRDSDGIQTRERVSDTATSTSETIARVEFVWTRWEDHVLQFNVEGALNTLDNDFTQTEDVGAGPVIVEVPGANSRVEETRGDVLLKDTWTLGSYELEYGLGFEVSTIEQSGDAELERDFSFIKPQLALTYTAPRGTQTRLRAARDVSQLDFNDFVSASVFEDDDLALGNPDLRPETTWRLELSQERRIGKESVFKVLTFHDWVSDVEDLLPLSPTFEAPGNIGDGRRWGVEFETTLPLDAIGLRGGKLDVVARWQDSTVVDPVTAEDRDFSTGDTSGKLFPLGLGIENEYGYAIEFRQDLENAQFAWGWDLRARAERANFRVNELVIEDEGSEFNVFVETTRWLGLKVNLAAQNIFDTAETRDRILYVGERGLSPVARQELRSRERGFRMSLDVSGVF